MSKLEDDYIRQKGINEATRYLALKKYQAKMKKLKWDEIIMIILVSWVGITTVLIMSINLGGGS